MGMRENAYGHHKRLEFIFSEIERCLGQKELLKEEIKILDVGCGTGVMITLPLAAAGYNILGIDSDENSIKLASKLNTFANASFIHGSVENKDFENRFDIIICSEVLEHQRDPYYFIRRLKGILKNEGFLIVTIPNGYGLFEIDKFFWSLFTGIIPYFGEAVAAMERRVKKLLLYFPLKSEEEMEKNRPEIPSTLCFSKHYCKFTYSSITNLLRRLGLRIINFSNSTLWAGPFADYFMRDLEKLIIFNSRIVDFLPRFLVSGWYFSCQRDK